MLNLVEELRLVVMMTLKNVAWIVLGVGSNLAMAVMRMMVVGLERQLQGRFQCFNLPLKVLQQVCAWREHLSSKEGSSLYVVD
jgi:hypothetical protein